MFRKEIKEFLVLGEKSFTLHKTFMAIKEGGEKGPRQGINTSLAGLRERTIQQYK